MGFKHYLLVAFAVAVSACANTEFKQYEGRNNIVEGRGGTKSIVDGMEIWEDGDPPRRFEVVGLIKDDRPDGIIPMMRFKSDIVKKAKLAGGQALVQIRNQSQIVGYHTSGAATANANGGLINIDGSSNTRVIRNNTSTFAVIKYLD